jgi:hypothetical protein
MYENPHAGTQLLKFTAQRRDALRGFCDIELPNGMQIFGCPVLVSRGRIRVIVPGRPRLDRTGRQVEIDGYRQFDKIMGWNCRELANAFDAAVIALLREQYPDALTETGKSGAASS